MVVVVVVVGGGASGTIFTSTEYRESVISMMRARSGSTGAVTLPTSPAVESTAMPTSMPSLLPLLISMIWSMFVGPWPTTVAITVG